VASFEGRVLASRAVPFAGTSVPGGGVNAFDIGLCPRQKLLGFLARTASFEERPNLADRNGEADRFRANRLFGDNPN
jgi:hypothetical protein